MVNFWGLSKKLRWGAGWWGLLFVLVLVGSLALGQMVYTPTMQRSIVTPTAIPVVPVATTLFAEDEGLAATPFPPLVTDYNLTDDPILAAAVDSRPTWQIAIDTLIKLVIVLLLAYATIVGLKWLQKSRNPIAAAGTTIQVLETVGLAPGKTLHLVVVGEKTLLIGATEQQLSLLTELTDVAIPIPQEATIMPVTPASSPPPIRVASLPSTGITPTPLNPSPLHPSAFEQMLTSKADEIIPIHQPDSLVDQESVEVTLSGRAPAASSGSGEWQTIISSMQAGVQHLKEAAGGSKR